MDHLPGPLCAGCGQCCRRMPGSYTPADMGDDVGAGLETLLRTGRVAIDWWEGDVAEPDEMFQVMYPRPSVEGQEGRILHGSWGGTCTHLGESGCQLPREQMPEQCRSLLPRTDPDDGCPGLTKGEVALMWRPHQDMIQEVLDRLEITDERSRL